MIYAYNTIYLDKFSRILHELHKYREVERLISHFYNEMIFEKKNMQSRSTNLLTSFLKNHISFNLRFFPINSRTSFSVKFGTITLN